MSVLAVEIKVIGTEQQFVKVKPLEVNSPLKTPFHSKVMYSLLTFIINFKYICN